MELDPSLADRGFIYAVARRIVRDDEEAEDVTQEALLLAHTRRHQYRGDASYRTWLYRIAVSVALSSLRRRRRSHRKLEALAMHVEVAPPDVDTRPDDVLERRRTHERLAAAVHALPPIYRDVLELRVAEDCTDHVAAARLGLTVSAVKIRAFRARNQLRDALLAA